MIHFLLVSESCYSEYEKCLIPVTLSAVFFFSEITLR